MEHVPDVFVLVLGAEPLVTPVTPISCVMDVEQLMPLVPLVLVLQVLTGLQRPIVLCAMVLTARMEESLIPLVLLVSTVLLLGPDLLVKFATSVFMVLLMPSALLVLVILTGEALPVISANTPHAPTPLPLIILVMDVPAPEPSSLDRTVTSAMKRVCVTTEEPMIPTLLSVLDVSVMILLLGEAADARTVSTTADLTEEITLEEFAIDALATLLSLEMALIATAVTPTLFATEKV